MSEAGECMKPIPGYEGLYAATAEGQIVGLLRNKARRCEKSNRGYLRVGLSKNGVRKHHAVHRLVASAFLGEIPSAMDVHHINCDKTDNRIKNLKIISRSGNLERAYADGLRHPRRGEDNPSARLTEIEVRQIRAMLDDGVSRQRIGRVFGVAWSTVNRIKRGEKWGWLDANENKGGDE